MPVIPVRGYTCDIVPKNANDRMPDFSAGLRWNFGGNIYFLTNIKDNCWRIVSYLDVAPGRDDFFDKGRGE